MRIKNSGIPELILNNITGKIGDIVIRKRYGKTIISAVPISYKKSNSERAINNRKRFAAISSISTALNKVPEFKELWRKEAKNKMSSHNAAAKYISKQIRKDGVPNITSIYPSNFTELKCQLFYKDKSGFSTKVDYRQMKNSPEEAGSEKNKGYIKGIGSDKERIYTNMRYIRIIALFIMKDSVIIPDRYNVICSDFYAADKTKEEIIIDTNLFDSDISMISNFNTVDVRYSAGLYDKNKILINVSNTYSIDNY